MASLPEDRPLSRRTFFLDAGRLGGALLLSGPTLERALAAPPPGPSAAPEDLARGVLATGRPAAGPLPERVFSGLRWRMLGPFRSGRVDAVSGVPGRPNEFYFGAVNGGVWKSMDAGRTWAPVFDAQPVASIGALAVAPSAPDVVYVGTGESTLRDSVGYGNGMYKSTDAGKTWTHIGLEDTQHIGRDRGGSHEPGHRLRRGHRPLLRAEPGPRRLPLEGRRQDVAEGALRERRRRCDRGRDRPEEPSNVVYAGLWNTRRPPWFVYAPTNGPGGGIYKSTDGGDTWKRLTRGLPEKGVGRSGIAVCPSQPNRVYAVIDDLEPPPGAPAPDPAANAFGAAPPARAASSARTTRGENWTKLSADPGAVGARLVLRARRGRPAGRRPRLRLERGRWPARRTAGKTWEALRGSPGGDDYHQAWISPDDPNTMIMASDQGCIITRNARAEAAATSTWSSWLNQPIAQIYHLSVDYRFPYWVTGAQQDSGAVAVRVAREVRARSRCATGSRSAPAARAGARPAILCIRASSTAAPASRYDLEANRTVPGTTAPEGPERGPDGLDAAARAVAGRPARALLREPVPLQVHGRREDVDADQRRPHAAGRRHPPEPRRGGRRADRPQRQARRDLHDRARRRSWCRWSGSARTTA